jgi:hypothetical protein
MEGYQHIFSLTTTPSPSPSPIITPATETAQSEKLQRTRGRPLLPFAVLLPRRTAWRTTEDETATRKKEKKKKKSKNNSNA